MTLAEELSKYRNASALDLLGLALRWLRMHTALPLRPPAPDPRVVVTLTTIPSRVRHLRPVLRSLLDQDVPPRQVVLACPVLSRREGAPYTIPGWLKSMTDVRVLQADRDWGPATKLLPALREYSTPGTLLVYLDDDNVYPRDLISNLLTWHARFAGAALGLRGWSLPPSLDWGRTRTLYGSGLKRPVRVDVLTATWGVMIPAEAFDEAVFDYGGHPGDAFFVDDIWFSGHLARRGIARWVVPARVPPLPTRAASVLDLGTHENGDGERNNRVIQAFRDHWSASRG